VVGDPTAWPGAVDTFSRELRLHGDRCSTGTDLAQHKQEHLTLTYMQNLSWVLIRAALQCGGFVGICRTTYFTAGRIRSYPPGAITLGIDNRLD